MQKFIFIILVSLCLAVNTEQIYENSYALIIGIDKYENQNKISEKLVPKDKEKFLNCPWEKLIIEEWEKNNEL